MKAVNSPSAERKKKNAHTHTQHTHKDLLGDGKQGLGTMFTANYISQAEISQGPLLMRHSISKYKKDKAKAHISKFK